jgi:hypothetical protein
MMEEDNERLEFVPEKCVHAQRRDVHVKFRKNSLKCQSAAVMVHLDRLLSAISGGLPTKRLIPEF